MISLFLWAVVYTQTTETKQATVTVRHLVKKGLDESKYVLTSDLSIPLQVRVVASADRLNELELLSDQLEGTVNLTSASPDKDGKYMAPVSLWPPKLRDVAVQQIPRIPVTIEPVVSRTVPVEVKPVGKLPEGAGEIETPVLPVQKTVRIFGPKSEIARVEGAQATLPLGNLDPMQTSPYVSDILVYGKGHLDHVRVDPPSTDIQPVFTSSAVQMPFAVTASIIGTPAKGFGIAGNVVTPQNVSVTGGVSALSRARRLVTDPIDVTGKKADYELTIPIQRPPGIRSISPSSVRVRVNIRPMAKTGER
ncbi:YbbR-like domain-containing protein [Fimbriimonas ginsengisoli]|nr:CdaR family protein [Fimbriimonas ginsengisoli]